MWRQIAGIEWCGEGRLSYIPTETWEAVTRFELQKTIFYSYLIRYWNLHYSELIVSEITSQITGVSMVCSTVCSGVDHRKHQCSESLAFVRRILRWLMNSPHRRPVTRSLFPFDDIIMVSSASTFKSMSDIFSVKIMNSLNASSIRESTCS